MKSKLSITVGILALLFLASGGCVRTATANHKYLGEPDPRSKEFTIGVGDGLRISVWRNEDVSSEVIVRPDGTITIPLIGDVRAGGQTPSRLRETIKKRLAGWLRDQNIVVTVAVTAVNSYHFTVSGEVNTSGVFNSVHYVTVIDAIAMAGGFTRYAERERIVLLRRFGGHQRKPRRIPVDFKALTEDGKDHMNIVIMPDDIILVP